jgi:hypothetical protein
MMQATGDSSFAANARTCFRRINTLDPRACPASPRRGGGRGLGGGLESRVASMKSLKVNEKCIYYLKVSYHQNITMFSFLCSHAAYCSPIYPGMDSECEAKMFSHARIFIERGRPGDCCAEPGVSQVMCV